MSETSSSLNWTTIQPILFNDADADVLVILDCCFAASARYHTFATGRGTKEILAACADRLATTGVEYCSFTSVLTQKIKEASIENQKRGSPFSVVELHSELHDDKRLRSQPHYAKVNRNGYHSISLIPFPLSSRCQLHDSSPSSIGSLSVLSDDPSIRDKPTRVLLSIHTSRSPTGDLVSFLKDECMLPLYVTGMKIEEEIGRAHV